MGSDFEWPSAADDSEGDSDAGDESDAKAPPQPSGMRGMRSQSSAELSLERVVATGIGIADDVGLDALSLRKLASELGVPVMSLYRHVHSKEQLIQLMADAALAEEPRHANTPMDWRAWLELAARREWALLQQHPWLAVVLNATRRNSTPSELERADWVMRALAGSGLVAAEKLELRWLLRAFIQGLAMQFATAEQAATDTGFVEDELRRRLDAERRALAASSRHPHFESVLRALPEDFELDVDRVFEAGLALLLDGVAITILRRKSA